jgi:hypothetical protein
VVTSSSETSTSSTSREPIDLADRPELIDRYIELAAKRRSPKTIHNHLPLRNVMFRRAVVLD